MTRTTKEIIQLLTNVDDILLVVSKELAKHNKLWKQDQVEFAQRKLAEVKGDLVVELHKEIKSA